MRRLCAQNGNTAVDNEYGHKIAWSSIFLCFAGHALLLPVTDGVLTKLVY